VTLQTYLRILRERWRLVTLVLIVGTGLAVIITILTPRSYVATAQVYVGSNTSNDPLAQYNQVLSNQTQVATYADIVHSPDILHKVEQLNNLPQTAAEDAALTSKISAVAPQQRSLVNISVSDSSADNAASLANATARAFVEVVENYSKPTGSSTPASRLIVSGPATAPTSPVAPRPGLNIVLGFILGLLGGISLAVARDVLDRRVKSAEALSRVAGVPTMGVIIDDPKTARHPIATRAGARNRRAENFRQLRANLQFANVDRHPRIIAITSSIPNEGKTTAAINLASTLAEAGFRVCLVDADLRRPSVAKALGLPGSVGLTSVLIHQIGVMEAAQHAGSSLYVLTSGPTPPNPSEVLASSYVRDVIRSLLDNVDYVVLDTAPLLPVADGAEVAALADGTLVVVRYNETTDTQVKRALEHLHRVGAQVLGTVLNRMPEKQEHGGYQYTYYREEPSRTAPARDEARRAVRETTVSS
jgi:capsular exopolysaccharide synthesis family protein